jgi:1,4-dihydroxy-2-naphthoate octaprenyltransferase
MTHMPSKLKIWIDSTRPKTLPAAVGPVLIGAALAFDAGGLHVITLLTTLAAAVLIQIGTNLSNDYFDYVKGADTEERTGPVRATQAGLVSPTAMLAAWVSGIGRDICSCFLRAGGGRRNLLFAGRFDQYGCDRCGVGSGTDFNGDFSR